MNRAIVFVLVTVLVDVIGLGIIIPVMPVLIQELTGEGLDRAAIYGGWLLFLYALLQFFFAPILGGLSDRFGRRPVLLLSLFAFGIDYALMGLAPSLGWLFLGRAIAGAAGASVTTANAYIADVTPAEKRAANFGLIGAAWGVGFVIGPVLGGLLGELGPRVPFFASAALALANVAYGFFVLPETLPPEKRRRFDWRRANPVGSLVRMASHPVLGSLIGVLVLYQIAHDANPSTWSYYTMERFGWSERDVGLSLGVVGLSISVVYGALVGPIVRRLGEQRTVVFGLLLMATGFFGYSLATRSWMMIAFIFPFALGCVAMPALRGMMANRVEADEQGELQGALTSLASLTAIGAPLLMTRLFGVFAADDAPIYFPGMAFFVAGALLVGASLWFLRARARLPAPVTPAADIVAEGAGPAATL
ncbi:MAG: MFS transporter [Acidobacteria bacterium]|nr:MAG: MFS transporter [Acidobacteriota bacterium]REK07770.1 MAG: MFS transporter [Acidobacteriota bacterium]